MIKAGYAIGITTATISGATRIQFTTGNLTKAITNLADNAASFARTNNTVTSGNSYNGKQIFVIGLGANGGSGQ